MKLFPARYPSKCFEFILTTSGDGVVAVAIIFPIFHKRKVRLSNFTEVLKLAGGQAIASRQYLIPQPGLLTTSFWKVLVYSNFASDHNQNH